MINKKLLVASILFTLIWSSGFIVGRMIVGVVSPNIFLGLRFLFASVLFALLANTYKHTYPNLQEITKHILVGILCNAFYLGGSYWAISHGMPAGIMALLGGLQPLFTLLIVCLLFGEKFSIHALIGILIGLLGIYLALPMTSHNQSYTPFVIMISVLSILSFTLGVIIQRYYTKGSQLLPSLAIQNLAGAGCALVMAWVLHEQTLHLRFEFLFSLVWAVLVLSGAGIYLLFYLTQKGSSVKTTSLMLLCPPLAAIQAKLFFDENLTVIQMIGFVVALAGVALCQKTK